MDPKAMARSPLGKLVRIDGGRAYLPAPLPDTLVLPPDLAVEVERATVAVATLGGLGETLENPHLLVDPFLRREAVLSSMIEGTQASLSDILELEAHAPPPAGDAGEVLNYVRAMERGIALLEDLPVCLRLIHELHAVLLRGVRGDHARPGEFRDLQVWIGRPGTGIDQARSVPPPEAEVADLMAAWERWANAPVALPILVRCALLHYQFETIHPYRDGNGRVGRLLIVLFLMAQGLLTQPLLYVSSYFERHRSEYYDHLLRVSATGDWMPWLSFFMAGVAEQANDAIRRSRELRDLRRTYLARMQEAGESANAFQLVDLLFRRPRVTRRSVAEDLGLTTAGARQLLDRMRRRGLVSDVPNRRPAVFVAPEILDIVDV
ncbi:MAG: Fic family protein [Dehalococcoidia bacterium]|nr:Fic family protein [Dehalococcoidia bacterium]